MRLSALALEAIARASDPTAPPAGRSRECTRCSAMTDAITRAKPDWKAPPVETWVGATGVRYWSTLCVQCSVKDRDERVALAVANGESRDVAVRKYGRRW